MSIIPPRPLFEDRPSGLADFDQRSRNIFKRLVDTYMAKSNSTDGIGFTP